MPWGSIISAGASLAGGLLGANSQSQANSANAKIAREQMAMQREFAQNGVRWRVADAKAAGLHPLAALGAQGASYTPVAGTNMPTDYSFLGDMGQNINRAMQAKMTPEERQLQELQIRNAELQNDQVSANIRDTELGSALKMLQLYTPPPMPSANIGKKQGQGDEPIQYYQKAYDLEGRPIRVVNEKYDPDIYNEAVVAGRAFWNDLKSNGQAIWNYLTK